MTFSLTFFLRSCICENAVERGKKRKGEQEFVVRACPHVMLAQKPGFPPWACSPSIRNMTEADGGRRSGRRRPLRVRITLVGPSNSGKSCLIKRYCEKRFVAKHQPTLGVDYGATKIYVDKVEVGVHVFDCSGADLFEAVRQEFYADAHGLVVVLEASDGHWEEALAASLEEAKAALARVNRTLDHLAVAVVVNKMDK